MPGAEFERKTIPQDACIIATDFSEALRQPLLAEPLEIFLLQLGALRGLNAVAIIAWQDEQNEPLHKSLEITRLFEGIQENIVKVGNLTAAVQGLITKIDGPFYDATKDIEGLRIMRYGIWRDGIDIEQVISFFIKEAEQDPWNRNRGFVRPRLLSTIALVG